MSNPKVSVLMTAYNRENYIRDAIESVLASSFTDFELIIVDDRSTDNTVEIARQYLTDKRVKLYINEKNLGDYPNRNKAAEYACGTYLKYVDSDDMIYPHGLEVMVGSMVQFPDAGLGLCRPVADYRPYPIQISQEEAFIEHFLGDGLLSNAPLSAIIRRQAFIDAGKFSGMRYAGDNEMWLRLASRYPTVKMVAGLTWWRSHGEQEYVLGTKSFVYPRALYEVGIEALTSVNCPMSIKAQQKAIQKHQSAYTRHILSLALKSRKPQSAYSLFRISSLTWEDLIKGSFNVLFKR